MTFLDEIGLSRVWDKMKYYVDQKIKSDISGNAATATRLQTGRTIDGLYFDGTLSIKHFAVCGTAANVQAKTATNYQLQLAEGTKVAIRFTYGINVDNPTLNISGTGARPIYYKNKPLKVGAIGANTLVELVYYNSHWDVIGELITSGTAQSFFNSYNFNDYVIAGKYVIHRSGETFTNGPGSQLSGWLDVLENQGLITQTMTDYTGRLVNIRGCHNNSWSQWVTYSGAFSPLAGSTLNFKSGTSQVTRNLSYYSVIGDRVFVDFSFQGNIPAGTTLYFANYPTPVSDYDGRFFEYNVGVPVMYSVAQYTNSFTVRLVSAVNGWVRGQISYRTNGVIHA